jgi:hypothetical protein
MYHELFMHWKGLAGERLVMILKDLIKEGLMTLAGWIRDALNGSTQALIHAFDSLSNNNDCSKHLKE